MQENHENCNDLNCHHEIALPKTEEKEFQPIPSVPDALVEPVPDKKDEKILKCFACKEPIIDGKGMPTRYGEKICVKCYIQMTTPIVSDVKIGRNDPCLCGKLDSNGKPVKYKKCCWLKQK